MKPILAFMTSLSLLGVSLPVLAVPEVHPQSFTNEVLLSRSERYQAWLSRGDRAVRAGEPSQAITYYDQAIAVNPQNPAAWEGLGDAQFRQGNYREAIEAYNEATNMAANDESLTRKLQTARRRLAQRYE